MKLTQRTQAQMDSPIGAMAHLLDQIPPDKPLLDLSQGAPGFPPAPEVAARIAEVAASPDGARYAPLMGLQPLREAFAADIHAAYGGDVEPYDICITAGCNQAFCVVASALAEPGDEIILTLPYYFNHDMWLGLDGVTARYLDPGDAVVPSVAAAEELITDATRAVVLVSPGNPTGQTLEPELLQEFADMAERRDIVLIVDETYRSFVPGDEPPHRLFDRLTWRDHVVSLHSFSKDLAIPGHRVGAIIAHPDLLCEAAKLIDCISICAPRVGQEAALTGITEAREWRADKIDEIADKQRVFEGVMAEKPGGFELLAAGAYYGWVRHPFVDEPSQNVARRLLLEQGVLVIPGDAFGPTDPGCLRFSFANADRNRIGELTDRLKAMRP